MRSTTLFITSSVLFSPLCLATWSLDHLEERSQIYLYIQCIELITTPPSNAGFHSTLVSRPTNSEASSRLKSFLRLLDCSSKSMIGHFIILIVAFSMDTEYDWQVGLLHVRTTCHTLFHSFLRYHVFKRSIFGRRIRAQPGVAKVRTGVDRRSTRPLNGTTHFSQRSSMLFPQLRSP